MTFELFNNGLCDEPPIDTFPNIALGPNGSVDSPPTLRLVAGNYSFRAICSGDANHAGNISECEPFGVDQVSSTTVTTVHHYPDGAPWGNATHPAGSRAFDTATVSGGPPGLFAPTGLVHFELFDNGLCDEPPIDTLLGVGLNASGVVNSPDTGPLTAGNYAFRVIYGGDDNHAGNVSECVPFGVDRTNSTVLTTVHQFPGGDAWVNTNPAGTPAFDRAVVHGTPGSGTPTGTVDLELFDNGLCHQPPIDTFPNIALSGGAADSPSTGPLAAGSYSFRAIYSGDDNHAAAISDCEPFGVAEVSITLTKTVPRPSSASPAR